MGLLLDKVTNSSKIPQLTRGALEQASKEQLIDLILLMQEKYEAQLAVLNTRIADLERRLGMNSSNSSKPPSSDSPRDKRKLARSRRKRKRRKQGAQPGHQAHLRPLVPVEEVDELERIVPARCERCGKTNLLVDEESPHRHQVWDIPPIKPTVHEIQLFLCQCRDCGHVTRAHLPHGVPSGGFGPRAQAIVSYLSGVGRQSKRLVKAMMKDLLGLDMCIGSVSACENAVSEAVAQPVEQARRYAQDCAVLYADETSWWQKNIKSWLWVAVAPLVTVFMIHGDRGRKAARKLLGQFKGILVTDRWKPYRVHNGLRQFCWAHLLRDFVGFSELKGKAGLIGGLLVEKTELMFKWWHRIREGTMDRATFRRKMARLRIEVENLLIDGELCGQRPISGKCKNILSECNCLWVFVDHEGVEPTNNVAERQVRHGVMWRRLCFGTQSESGSRFAERIMTVHATCRQQGRNILDYLTEACAAQINHSQAPSLLPSASQPR